jgi:hypothetical protein
MATKVLLCALLGTAVSKPLAQGDTRFRRTFVAEVETEPESFGFGPVRIKTVPFLTTIKIITGLLMSIALLQFLYSSVRIRSQEKSELRSQEKSELKCEKICEINPKIYTICPKSRT